MRVTKHTFWNLIEARSSRAVADFGFTNLELGELSGVEPLDGSDRELGGYWVNDVEEALRDAVRRFRGIGSTATDALAA